MKSYKTFLNEAIRELSKEPIMASQVGDELHHEGKSIEPHTVALNHGIAEKSADSPHYTIYKQNSIGKETRMHLSHDEIAAIHAHMIKHKG